MVQWSGVTYKVKYKWRKFKEQLYCWHYQARDLLVFYLPSQRIRDLPKSQALPLGLIAIVLLCASCGYLFISTFLRNLTTTYLSLDDDSTSICEEVLRSNDGDYFTDTEGYWRGNREYNYSHGLYQYKSQIKHSLADYQVQARGLVYDILGPIGVYMQNHNLGMNLLMLMTYQSTFTSTDNDQDTDTFLFTSTPSTVFNSGVYSASAGTIDSLCDVDPSISFDRANAKINIAYNYAEFANSTACMNVFNPRHLGYDPQWSGQVFEIAIDVNTLATTLAVNMNLLPPDSFEAIDQSPFEETNGGIKYFFTQFEDMQSFVCFGYPDNPNRYSCSMQIGQLLVFPLFNHAGYDGTYPRYCECDDEEWRHSENCNTFSLLSGFLFYDYNATETPTDSLDRLLALVFNSTSSGFDINRNSFDVSYDIGNPSSQTRGDQAWKDEHFEFCRSPDGKFCSIVTFYKLSSENSVTTYHFPLYDGSCNDFVTFSEEAAERFINTPPVELVEPYMRCKRTVLAAFSDSVGIVSGNVTALSPLLMLAVFYIYFYGYVQWKGVKQDMTYSQLELNAIAKFFTFNMALARDGLHPTQLRAEAAAASGTTDGQLDRQTILEESVLLRLLRELKQEEVCQRFHAPLKEDDSDEEGEEAKPRGSGLASSTNPMRTDDSYTKSNSSSSSSQGESGVEMKGVDVEAQAAKKRRKRKKKKPVRTDPNVLLNPLVYRLDY